MLGKIREEPCDPVAFCESRTLSHILLLMFPKGSVGYLKIVTSRTLHSDKWIANNRMLS